MSLESSQISQGFFAFLCLQLFLLQSILEKRRPIAHLLELCVRIPGSDFFLAVPGVPLVDGPEQGFQRQGTDDAGGREAQRAAESRWVFWLLLVDEDEGSCDAAAVALVVGIVLVMGCYGWWMYGKGRKEWDFTLC